ncbi:hypothetical protein ABW20_dc0103351 [Dactylellina cionopaga]|nr:hypothetical protein ABW20_dc0103351 [Dactylellina cionopaga]
MLERGGSDLDITDPNDMRPTTSNSLAKPENLPQTRRSMLVLQNINKNWSRPFTKPQRVSPIAMPPPNFGPQRPPRSPPRVSSLEPSPFSQSSTNLAVTTSPFLNLLNRPRSKTVPTSPSAPIFPLHITDQEVSNLAAFDDWDTSSLSIQDRILYSIAAAEATTADPGAPPHARASPTSSTGTVTRTHRSSSMPTPPRTPPQQQRLRTSSVGSSSRNHRQSLRIVAPVPTSPTATPPAIAMKKSFTNSSTHLRHMGINIPLCDSPDREHSVRLASSPLQPPSMLRDVESHDTSVPSSNYSDTSDTSIGKYDAAAWQARWAATLERKVTPPMPGFEVSPQESMRRMREERELQQSRQKQQHPQPHLLSSTSWIAEESSESDTSLDYGMRARRSYAAPATPNTNEFPRNVITDMIDAMQDGVVTRQY